MDKRLILCAGTTESSRYAYSYLRSDGLAVTQKPSPEVTHLLLDVPSFAPDGKLRGGGDVEDLLMQLPSEVIVCGGNLNPPALAAYRTVDLLQDADYLAENAYITAECALEITMPRLKTTLRGCPVLIIGWGRIGKCLGHLLQEIGANITIAARKEADRAMIRALGYHAADAAQLGNSLPLFRIIYNTAPGTVLHREQTALCHPDCLMIDLASKLGIECSDVIWARGLPGIHCPESSGKLIGETLIRLLQKEETS